MVMLRVTHSGGRGTRRRRQRGAAAVEFALILPLLLIMLLGIIDFGLYFFNDLQLTHVARDAARYLSVGKVAEANAAIAGATLVSAGPPAVSINPGTTGNPATITVTATYRFLTPLPLIAGMGATKGINASVVMRRE